MKRFLPLLMLLLLIPAVAPGQLLVVDEDARQELDLRIQAGIEYVWKDVQTDEYTIGATKFGNSIEIREVQDLENVHAINFVQAPGHPVAKTDVVVLEIDEPFVSDLEMQKRGVSLYISRCLDFNEENNVCSSWDTPAISFTENVSTIEFGLSESGVFAGSLTKQTPTTPEQQATPEPQTVQTLAVSNFTVTAGASGEVFDSNCGGSGTGNTLLSASSNVHWGIDQTGSGRIREGFLQFDTSALPDGATVTAANLGVYLELTQVEGGDGLTATVYSCDYGPTLDNTDYGISTSTNHGTLFDDTDTAGQYHELALTVAGGEISLTGNTTFCVRVNQACRDERDRWRVRTSSSYNAPYLNVTYTTNTAPTITTNLADTPDPVDAGNEINYTLTADDGQGDDYSITVCRTDSITDGYPGVCATGQHLCNATGFADDAQSDCGYTTAASDVGTLTAFAFACDNQSTCSASNTTSTTVDPVYGSLNISFDVPANNSELARNKGFRVNVTIGCEGTAVATCGQIDGTVLYNSSSSIPDTNISRTEGDMPLSIITSNLDDAVYTGNFFNVTAQEPLVSDIGYNGSHFYIHGYTDERVREFTRNGTYTGFNFSVTGQIADGSGVAHSGTHIYVVEDTIDQSIWEYNLSGDFTGFNFSIQSECSSDGGFDANSTHFVILCFDEAVHLYNATGDYQGEIFNVTDQTSNGRGIAIVPDGYYILDATDDIVMHYYLDGTYSGSFLNVSDQTTDGTQLVSDGEYLYVGEFLHTNPEDYFEYVVVDQNPKLSTTLSSGQNYTFSWLINATGSIGESYLLKTIVNASTYPDDITSNETGSYFITIGSPYGYLNVTTNSPADGTNISGNTTFALNATIECIGALGASCGVVEASARLNFTSTSPETLINTTSSSPMYLISGSNPRVTSSLTAGDTYEAAWTVNFTGGDAYVVDIQFNSTTYPNNITTNSSESRTVCIGTCPPSGYTITSPPAGTAWLLANDTSVDVTSVAQTGLQEVIVSDTQNNFSAVLWINFAANLDASSVSIDYNYSTLKGVFHNTSTLTGVTNISLLIPRLLNSDSVFVCPGANTTAQVRRDCANIVYLETGQRRQGMRLERVTYNNTPYYRVHNISGTGGGENNITISVTSPVEPLTNISITINNASGSCYVYVHRPDGFRDNITGSVSSQVCTAYYIPSYLNGTYYVNATIAGNNSNTRTFNVTMADTILGIENLAVNASEYFVGTRLNFSWKVNDSAGNNISSLGTITRDEDPNATNYELAQYAGAYEIRREITEITQAGNVTARLHVNFNTHAGFSWGEIRSGTHVNITLVGRDGTSGLPGTVTVTNHTRNSGTDVSHTFSSSGGIYEFNVSVNADIDGEDRGAYLEITIPANQSLSDVLIRVDGIRMVHDSFQTDHLYFGDIVVSDDKLNGGDDGDVNYSQGDKLSEWGHFPIYMPLNPNRNGLIYDLTTPRLESIVNNYQESNGNYEENFTWKDYDVENLSVKLYVDKWGYRHNVSQTLNINTSNQADGVDLIIEGFAANASWYYPGSTLRYTWTINDTTDVQHAGLRYNDSDINPDVSSGELGNGASAIEVYREIINISTDGTIVARAHIEFDSESASGLGAIRAGSQVNISAQGRDGVSPLPAAITVTHGTQGNAQLAYNMTNASGVYHLSGRITTSTEGTKNNAYLQFSIPSTHSLSDVTIKVNKIRYGYPNGLNDYVYIFGEQVGDGDLNGGDDGLVFYELGDQFGKQGDFPILATLSPVEEGLLYAEMKPALESLNNNLTDLGSGNYRSDVAWKDYVRFNHTSYLYADMWPYGADSASTSQIEKSTTKAGTLSVGEVKANQTWYAPGHNITFNVSVNISGVAFGDLNNSEQNPDVNGGELGDGRAMLQIYKKLMNVTEDGGSHVRLYVEFDNEPAIGAVQQIYSGSTVNISIRGFNGTEPVFENISVANYSYGSGAVSHTFTNNSNNYEWIVTVDSTLTSVTDGSYLEFFLPEGRFLTDVIIRVNNIRYRYYNQNTDYVQIADVRLTDATFNDEDKDGTPDDGDVYWRTGDRFGALGDLPIYMPLTPEDGLIALRETLSGWNEDNNATINFINTNYTTNHYWESDSAQDFNMRFCVNKWDLNNNRFLCQEGLTLSRPQPIITAISDSTSSGNPVKNNSNVTFNVTWSLVEEPTEVAEMYVCNSTIIVSGSGCADYTFCETTYSVAKTQTCDFTAHDNLSGTNSYWVRVCTNSGSCSDVSSEQFFYYDLGGPIISTNYTIPTQIYYDGSSPLSVLIQANVTDISNDLSWVNFTLIAPNGTVMISNVNGTNGSDLWNSSSFSLDRYGRWNYTINASDSSGNKDSTAGQLRFLQISESISPSPVTAGEEYTVSGHINDSLFADYADGVMYIYVNGSQKIWNKTLGDWWNISWLYREQINLTPPANLNYSNATLRINISTAGKIAAGQMNANCSDIRVTNRYAQQIAHLTDTGSCNTDNTTLWVPFNITDGQNNIFFVYYGNSQANFETTYSNPDNSLQLYLRFENHSWYGENDTLAFDFSGNQNNGTINNALYNTSGRFGQGLKLDGSGDWVNPNLNIDQSASTPGSTWMAWVYPDTTSGGRTIFGTDNGGWDWTLRQNGATWYVHTGSGSSSASHSVDLNTWQHIVAVFDRTNSRIRVYKNGVEYNVTTIGYDSSSTNIAIGRDEFGDDEYYNGRIDEIRIYNRSLTEEEVQAIYDESATAFTDQEELTKTNSSGHYSYNITAPNTDASLLVKVNATYDASDNIREYGQNTVSLTAQRDSLLNVTLVSPAADSSVFFNELFNFTINVTCQYKPCGDVNASLDPTDWWDTGWTHRQAFNVTEGSGSNISNYSVRVFIDTQTLISAGKMESTCNDLRFASHKGVELSHFIWNDTPCNRTNTEAWVMIPHINASASATIYAYYGNPSAQNKSNGSNAFLWYDEFDTDTIGDYTQVSETWSWDSSGYVQDSTTNAEAALLVPGINVSNVWVETLARANDDDGTGPVARYSSAAAYYMCTTNPQGDTYGVAENAGRDGYLASAATGTQAASDWIRSVITTNDTLIGCMYNNSLRDTHLELNTTDASLTLNSVGISSYFNNPAAEFDYLLVRSYVYPEPTVAILGSEEQYAKSGLISTVAGTIPFYTTNSNPQNQSDTSCLSNMNASDSCLVTWTVNATGRPGTIHEFFAYANSTTNSSVIDGLSDTINITITNTPRLDSVILNATDDPINQTTANLTAYPINARNYTGFVYDWRLNGASIALLNMPFDNNVSENTSGAVRDYSLNSFNGTLGGGSSSLMPNWTTSAANVGGYNNSDDSNTYIDVPGFSVATNNITFIVWLNLESIAAYDGFIFSRSGTANGINVDDGGTQIGYTWNSDQWTWSGGPAIPLNQWFMTALVVNDTEATAYLFNSSGTYSGTNTAAHPVVTIDALEIGRDSFGDRVVDGLIDEVLILNRSLTQEQLTVIYNSGAPRYNLTVRQETVLGDVWSVAVTPINGTADGTTVVSNSLTIRDNPPNVTSVILNTTSSANTTSDNLTAYPVDASGYTALIYNWKVNGSDLTPLNVPLDRNAKDYSGKTNDGTITGATRITSGVSGGAYYFDGDDQIDFTDEPYFSPKNNSAMTISVWANTAGSAAAAGSGGCGASGRYFLAKGGSSNWEWAFENDNNDLFCFQLWDSSGTSIADVSASVTMNDSTWHHYVAVIDYPNALRVYRDGVKLGEVYEFGDQMIDGTQVVQAGRRGTGNFFIGSLDEIQIFNTTLTDEQITLLYNSGSSLQNITSFHGTFHSENWTVNVTATNGSQDSTSVMSSTLEIATGSVSIAASSSANRSTDNLTATPTNLNSSDQTLIYNWKVGGHPLNLVYAPFDSFGSETITDFSGRGNNGAAGGGIWNDSGLRGGSYEFDGNNEINFTDRSYYSPSNNGQMTISVWARVPTGAAGTGGSCGGPGRYFAAKGAGSNWEWGFENDNNAQICFSLWDLAAGSSQGQVNKTLTVNDGAWHHYVAVIDYPNYITLYVDGVFAHNDTTITAGMGDGTADVQLGARSTANYFIGGVDEFQIINRSLTSEQVSAMYNSGVPRHNFIRDTEISPEEVWSVDVTPASGPIGRMVTSNSHTVATDIPEVSIIILNATSDLNSTYDNLTAYPQGALNYHSLVYDWRIEGNSIAVLNMPFDVDVNGSQKLNVRDYSTLKNNGTLVGASTSGDPVFSPSGIKGSAYTFDSQDSSIFVPDHSSLDFEGGDWFTISLWFNASAVADSIDILVSKRDTVGYHLTTVGTGRIQWFIENSTSSSGIHYTNNSYADGEWHHLAVGRNASVMFLYYDGQLINTSATVEGDLSNSLNLRIGGSNGSEGSWNGSIDEVIIFNRSLSPAMIQTIYNSGSPRTNITAFEETVSGENWTVAVTPTNRSQDGTTVLSNTLQITAAIPAAPTLVTPTNNNKTLTSRYPVFDWNDSVGANYYEVNISAPSGCAVIPNVNVTPSTYTSLSELCVDNTYNWTVRACNAGNQCSAWASQFNFTILSVLSVNLTTNNTDFGSMQPSTLLVNHTNSTLDSDPAPLVYANIGNVRFNVTFRANTALWATQALSTLYFQYADENSTDWKNVTSSYTLVNNSVMWGTSRELEINVTVPIGEEQGTKNSDVQIFVESVE